MLDNIYKLVYALFIDQNNDLLAWQPAENLVLAADAPGDENYHPAGFEEPNGHHALVCGMLLEGCPEDLIWAVQSCKDGLDYMIT